MAEDSIINDTMRNAIGIESEPVEYPVERWHIKRFAEAVGETNPLYLDETEARKTRHGGVIAPPTFYRAFYPKEPPVNVMQEANLKRVLDGGSEWEFFEPIRPGDTISVTSKLGELNVKQGRAGPMLIVAVDHTYRNQYGVTTAVQRQNRILY